MHPLSKTARARQRHRRPKVTRDEILLCFTFVHRVYTLWMIPIFRNKFSNLPPPPMSEPLIYRMERIMADKKCCHPRALLPKISVKSKHPEKLWVWKVKKGGTACLCLPHLVAYLDAASSPKPLESKGAQPLAVRTAQVYEPWPGSDEDIFWRAATRFPLHCQWHFCSPPRRAVSE